MTDTTKKAPALEVFTVREYTTNGEKDSEWTRIGAAWAHKDGKGFEIQLRAMPLDGRLVLRQPKAKPSDEA